MRLQLSVLLGLTWLACCQASLKCNLYNMGVKGAYECGLQWWTSQHIDKIVDHDPNLSGIVKDVLPMFNVSLAYIGESHLYGKIGTVFNESLYGKIGTDGSSKDPFAKIFESGAVVEPFGLFAAADLVIGQKVTAEELERFGLPTSLANKETWMQMYKYYFDQSCSDYAIKPFYDCMQTWMNTNCLAEDEPEVILNLLARVRDEYCSSSSASAKSSLLTKLNSDLGTVFSSVLDFLGIEKMTDSPYLFDIRNDSILWWNFSKLDRVGKVIEEDCSYLILYLLADLPILLTENSTAGAGVIIDRMIQFANSGLRCLLRSWQKVFPTFFEDHKRAISRMEIVSKRYSIKSLSPDSTEVGTIERASVVVYGDPHMLTYKATRSQTCSALGWQHYLSNEYFSLQAYAEAACQGCTASFVHHVKIAFTGLPKNITYESGPGLQPTKTLKVNGVSSVSTDEIKVADFGESVQVTDERSGAVFGFRKYRENYYFTVKMGVKLFDGSLGLLITGCPEEIDITIDQAGRLRRENTECETACADVPEPELYMDSCIFDCDTTNDIGVAEITKGLTALTKAVEEEDEKMLEVLGDAPQPSSATRFTATSLIVSAAALVLSMMAQIYM